MSSSPILACAAYIRTSTDDQQSPEDSKRWQLDIAARLVAPVGGKIVAIYHDIDVTHELPWTRRPEASRLLLDAADPHRGGRRSSSPSRSARSLAVSSTSS